MKTLKISLAAFIDDDGNIKGAIYYHPKIRKRIILEVKEAGEEEIVELLEQKDIKIKLSKNGNSIILPGLPENPLSRGVGRG